MTVDARFVSASGLGSIVIAVLMMAYFGPALAIAFHRIMSGGYLNFDKPMPAQTRLFGVAEALVQGLLWLPMLLLLLLRALLGK